jgi:hypothetical protein
MAAMRITIVLQILSALVGFVAAWLWFRSATGAAPPSSYKGIERLESFLNRASYWNRRAAVATALSVGLQATATMLTAAGWH